MEETYLPVGTKPVWIETKECYSTTVIDRDAETVERVEWTDEYKHFENQHRERHKKGQPCSDLVCPEFIWKRTGELIKKSDLIETCKRYFNYKKKD